MTESLQPQTWGSALSAVKGRLDKVERKIREFGSFGQPELTWILAGPIYTITMPKKRVPEDRRYHYLVVDLTTAGSTATVLRLMKNGSTVEDFTLAASSTYRKFDLADALVVVPGTDYVQLRIVTAGTGAVDLTADLWR